MCLLLVCMCCLSAVNMVRQTIQEVQAETTAMVTPGVTNVNVRQGASTGHPVITKVDGGQELIILEQPSNEWYKVSFVKNGQNYVGYIYAQYVVITGSGDEPAEVDFEEELTKQGFPESYKPYLRKLHELHPEWKFVAVHTGLEWQDVVENERNKQKQIKNLVQGTASAPHYNWRETEVGYNWEKDVWSPYDGTTWFAASKELVAYYLDPRTYMYETFIFAFEQLSYDGSVHSTSGVEAILAGSFMWDAKPVGEERTFSSLILEAGSTYNVSPYHIASRMRQEMGTTPGVNATGGSSSYPGIFNFFNIGAVDSAGGGAVEKGLKWASVSGSYGRPWNSAKKAILGGTEYIGASYINRGQDTLYTQKFNVTYKANLYNHQYMSNVQAPANEARSMYNAYRSRGMLNSPLVFKIPVYLNMPEQAVTKPADSGNPNHWLKSLSIEPAGFTPSFSGGVTEYNAIVEHNVSQVNIQGTTVNSRAKMQGLGAKTLAVGWNVFAITVTAENGNTRNYTVTVIRKDAQGNIPAQPNPDNPPAPAHPPAGEPSITTNYKVEGNYITGVEPGTEIGSFNNGFKVSGGSVEICSATGERLSSGRIATGTQIRVNGSASTKTYTVIIYGDTSGDGQITALDLLKLQKHITGANKLSGPYLQAANIKRSGEASALDLLKLQKHIIGATPIKQQ